MFDVVQLAWSTQTTAKGRITQCEEISKQVLDKQSLEEISFPTYFSEKKRRLNRYSKSLFLWERIILHVCGSRERGEFLVCTEGTNPTENKSF